MHINSLRSTKINMKRKIILIVIAIISFVGMLFFISPFFKRIINIGNIAGVIACLIIFLICVFNNKFNHIIQIIWDKPIGKFILILVSILIIAGIIMVAIFSALMIKAMNNRPKEPNILVVLGCKVNGTIPSLMLSERLEVAFEYLEDNPDVLCIVTGGQGENEDITEAKAMKDYLVNKGIDDFRILIEDKATSTVQNLEFSKKILDENNFGYNITIVTDGFHQYRASLIAKDLGLKPNALSAKTKPYLLPTYWVREWFGIAYETVL